MLLNKIDLVPPANSRMWQRYLRQEFPTLLFKANTQQQSKNLGAGTAIHKHSMLDNSELIEKMANQAKALGTDNLMNILKNYARIDG